MYSIRTGRIKITKIIRGILSVVLMLTLAMALITGCAPDPCSHSDEDGDGECDICKESFGNPDPCEHRDADDNGKCDLCTENFKDACDLSHRDADDNGKCDLCNGDFKDDCDVSHRDADDNYKCDNCGESYDDGCDTGHRDANDNGRCDSCNKTFSDKCDKTDCRDTDDNNKCDKCGFDFDDGKEPEPTGKKVLLVSIDGLRPDALADSAAYQRIKAMASYTMNARTINPSVTLPAHMSMFYGVEPSVHGVMTNNSTASHLLKNGITEALYEVGKTSALFYDWEKLNALSKYTVASNKVARTYINGEPQGAEEWFEASTVALSDAVIAHMQNTPTDFTFLYYALTDEMGHTYNWMSDKYYWGIDHVLENLERVLAAVPDDYVVIITSDHGGGGDNGKNSHGSTNAVDMTIPLFIIGDGFEANKVLDFDVSILDVAPTITDVMGVRTESYWVGKSIADAISEDAK